MRNNGEAKRTEDLSPRQFTEKDGLIVNIVGNQKDTEPKDNEQAKKNEKEKCTQVLKVHNLNMKSAAQITYLGDVISETGSIDETIAQRSQKALGITTQISAILQVSALNISILT